jgi:hypothetical protein
MLHIKTKHGNIYFQLGKGRFYTKDDELVFMTRLYALHPTIEHFCFTKGTHSWDIKQNPLAYSPNINDDEEQFIRYYFYNDQDERTCDIGSIR